MRLFVCIPLLFIALGAMAQTPQGADSLRGNEKAKVLEDIVVSAKRPLYSMDAEKLIYHVAEDPSIQGGTTSDALQNAPGVSVDIEGNVTLRGVSSVEIRLNGKPTKMRAEGLKAFLDALPANMLDRIETITNPPAKYATKAEAIIDIITVARIKKNQFLSLGLKGAASPRWDPLSPTSGPTKGWLSTSPPAAPTPTASARATAIPRAGTACYAPWNTTPCARAATAAAGTTT